MTEEEKQPWFEEAKRFKEENLARIDKQIEDAMEAKRRHDEAKMVAKSVKRD